MAMTRPPKPTTSRARLQSAGQARVGFARQNSSAASRYIWTTSPATSAHTPKPASASAMVGTILPATDVTSVTVVSSRKRICRCSRACGTAATTRGSSISADTATTGASPLKPNARSMRGAADDERRRGGDRGYQAGPERGADVVVLERLALQERRAEGAVGHGIGERRDDHRRCEQAELGRTDVAGRDRERDQVGRLQQQPAERGPGESRHDLAAIGPPGRGCG